MTGGIQALVNEALVHQRARRWPDAARIWQRAAVLAPDVPEVHLNLGNSLLAMGDVARAAASYRQALALRRHFPEASFGLGNVLKAQGRLEDAAGAYRAALALKPHFVAARYNLGNTLRALGRLNEALTAFQHAVTGKPDFVQGHGNMGALLYEMGRLQEAERALRTALTLAPDHAQSRDVLGLILWDTHRHAEAEEHARQTIARLPGHAPAYEQLAAILLETNRLDEAFAVFRKRSALASEERGAHLPHRRAHDELQAHYRGRPVGPAIECVGGERFPGSAINLRNDVAGTESRWKHERPQIVVIDDFLTPGALESLQHFCWNSTIWRQTFEAGYLGARLQQGFAAPLLAQIAEEVAHAYPAIFGDHPLLYAWAFNYDQRFSGTRIHADFAAVNVNFWITPDEANRNPETGGLLVWDAAAPSDWDFSRYNTDENRIRAFLSNSGARARRIPYRANRAVIFDSDLFHETDTMAFSPGYTNRRINITLLYGRRETGTASERITGTG